MRLPPTSHGNKTSDILRAYHQGPDHPCKLRIFYWLENTFGNKRIRVKTKSGFRLAVDRRDYIQRTVYDTREWEPEIEQLLQKTINAEDTFYDIGANVGYFSLLALQAGCRRVVAFEPSLELSKIFSHNVLINNFESSRWQLFRRALSDVPATLSYVAGPIENSGVGHLSTKKCDQHQSITVSTLDAMIEEHQLPQPTIIKLDVEGWEHRILKGAFNTLSKSLPRAIFFEADADSNGEIIDMPILEFLTERGYSIRHLERKIIEEKENYLATLNTTL
jgi:FkbM family methyltransferase